jgi:hypothetical protein
VSKELSADKQQIIIKVAAPFVDPGKALGMCSHVNAQLFEQQIPGDQIMTRLLLGPRLRSVHHQKIEELSRAFTDLIGEAKRTSSRFNRVPTWRNTIGFSGEESSVEVV